MRRVAADASAAGHARGNVWVRRTLAEVANVVGRMKGTYLAAQFRRIAARRGKGRAIVAVGHSVLVAIYYMLTRHEPYRDLGAQYFDEQARDHVQRRLVHRLEASRLRRVLTTDVHPRRLTAVSYFHTRPHARVRRHRDMKMAQTICYAGRSATVDSEVGLKPVP